MYLFKNNSDWKQEAVTKEKDQQQNEKDCDNKAYRKTELTQDLDLLDIDI